jgi:hypothetical protein
MRYRVPALSTRRHCQAGRTGLEGGVGTNVAMGHLSDGGQDNCAFVSVVRQGQGLWGGSLSRWASRIETIMGGGLVTMMVERQWRRLQ